MNRYSGNRSDEIRKRKLFGLRFTRGSARPRPGGQVERRSLRQPAVGKRREAVDLQKNAPDGRGALVVRGAHTRFQ